MALRNVTMTATGKNTEKDLCRHLKTQDWASSLVDETALDLNLSPPLPNPLS